MSALLEVENLAVTFPATRRRPPAKAIDGVNLEVGKGEIVALVGESGCGKSTLARVLVGLIKPTRGSVRTNGVELSYRAAALKKYRRSVQLVLQDPYSALNPRQRVFDAVAEGPKLHHLKGDLRQLVSESLSRAGMRPPERFFERYPFELSGGQQQRIVIASALALSPSILVADEPVASLDASVRGEILALILKLRDELGLSALVISHDLGLAWNIADRVAVMYLGRIVEQGPVEQVLLSPRHPYTRALLAATPDVQREHVPSLISGEPPDPTAVPPGCRFHPRCPHRTALAKQGINVDVCQLEDVALSEVGGHQVACHFATTSVDTTVATDTTTAADEKPEAGPDQSAAPVGEQPGGDVAEPLDAVTDVGA